jgi:hypothetical protein
MQFILAARIEDVLAAAIPPLADRLADSAHVRVAELPPDSGNGRQGATQEQPQSKAEPSPGG